MRFRSRQPFNIRCGSDFVTIHREQMFRYATGIRTCNPCNQVAGSCCCGCFVFDWPGYTPVGTNCMEQGSQAMPITMSPISPSGQRVYCSQYRNEGSNPTLMCVYSSSNFPFPDATLRMFKASDGSRYWTLTVTICHNLSASTVSIHYKESPDNQFTCQDGGSFVLDYVDYPSIDSCPEPGFPTTLDVLPTPTCPDPAPLNYDCTADVMPRKIRLDFQDGNVWRALPGGYDIHGGWDYWDYWTQMDGEPYPLPYPQYDLSFVNLIWNTEASVVDLPDGKKLINLYRQLDVYCGGPASFFGDPFATRAWSWQPRQLVWSRLNSGVGLYIVGPVFGMTVTYSCLNGMILQSLDVKDWFGGNGCGLGNPATRYLLDAPVPFYNGTIATLKYNPDMLYGAGNGCQVNTNYAYSAFNVPASPYGYTYVGSPHAPDIPYIPTIDIKLSW